MRLLLIVLALSMSGCVGLQSLPEPGTELRDYDTRLEPIGEPVVLTAVEVEPCSERICLVDPEQLWDLIGDAEANTLALWQARDAYHAKHAELVAVLAAGQQAELQAEIYHGLASGWSGTIETLAWPAAGLGGLMLLLIAL